MKPLFWIACWLPPYIAHDKTLVETMRAQISDETSNG